jgi:glycosidase
MGKIKLKYSSQISELIMLLGIVVIFVGCGQQNKSQESSMQNSIPSVQHVVWSKNSSIYEVNVRQFTPEGTLNAFAEHLGEIKALGVDIIWLMPIYPVGEKNRKGGLGSGYSVKDYRAVNPDMGTLEDLQNLVKQAHELGMYVLLDWIANHTAWDNNLTLEHPEWYNKDSLGQFMPPVADWADVIDLNYDQPDLRSYMIESMEYWLKEADVDGFRCDMAHMVPTDFWNEARKNLDQVKPVFMLAETENPDLVQEAFDMNYTWELFHIMEDIAQGKKDVASLRQNLLSEGEKYSPDAYRMNFTSNHDENSWAGTVFERFGDATKTFAALTTVLPGMPLVYSGQEVGLSKRLSFFEKDQIDWQNSDFRPLYTTLLEHKKSNQALWNGIAGGALEEIETDQSERVFAFSRQKNDGLVVAIFNLSPDSVSTTLSTSPDLKNLKDIISKESPTSNTFALAPWEFFILTQ